MSWPQLAFGCDFSTRGYRGYPALVYPDGRTLVVFLDDIIYLLRSYMGEELEKNAWFGAQGRNIASAPWPPLKWTTPGTDVGGW